MSSIQLTDCFTPVHKPQLRFTLSLKLQRKRRNDGKRFIMKKLTIITILLTIWVGLFSQGSINQVNNGNSANNKSYHPSGMEAYIDSWRNQEQVHVPGLSTAVLKNGELYWVYHSGLANMAQQIPVHDSSCFNVASISKTPIITAIMQFYELGLFELDDPAGDNLDFPIINPHFPASDMTHFQVMTHTSSIEEGGNSGAPVSLAQFIEGFFIPGGAYYYPSNFSSISPPGTHRYYSNVGPPLLAYITQVMAGQNFNEYCIENIFHPLGMNNTSYGAVNNMSTHYIWNGNNYEAINFSGGLHSTYPSSGLKTSAIELSRFLGMYMQGGTYNDSTILQPETIELILTPTSFVTSDGSLQCLIWFYSEYYDIYFHTGSNSYAFSIMAFDKDDQWGIIMLLNANANVSDLAGIVINLEYFASVYNPFSIASIEVNDTDGDQVIEANETFDLGLTLRNDMNYPDVAENIIATISVNSPYVNLISDSVVSLGTLNYLDEVQLPSDQFVFEVNENPEPGNVEFQIQFTWDDGVGYTLIFDLFIGHTDILLVRDEESVSVSFTGGLKTIQDRYLESLDTLGFLTNYWDLEERGDPTSEFIQNFPAVIWFTGSDEVNTLSENNQTTLEDYLDNGGQLFLSGQDISDELAGTNFLESYLFTEHIQNTWYGNKTIKGVENDPIGNGQIYQINIGDGIANQSSMSVVEPLEGAFKSFGYYPPLDGAAVRYENDTYKTIFFAFGFEAINGFNNRTNILDRILNTYFIMPHPCLPEGIIFSTQEEIDDFQSNYPGCVEIEGDVEISGDDITNLNGLNVLTSIGGSLTIENCESLNNLMGVDSLTSVNGDLIIKGNDSLTNLTGLESLTFVEGDFKIGMGELFSFNGNISLMSLTGLENLISIGGGFSIIGNHSLHDLSGLNNLSSIGDDLSIGCNDSLTNLSGLENLTSLEGDLRIGWWSIPVGWAGNNALTSLTGLNNITSVGGLGIGRNPSLTSLTGLDSLASISDRLGIGYNLSLASLTGLENLVSISDGLGIDHNPSLTSLTGLENLISIGGNLLIAHNDTLTSLSGLENIEAESISDLSIYGNAALSECEANSICEYLASPNGDIEIYENDTGCNSQQEVEEACDTSVIVTENTIKETFIISPNPLGSTTLIQYKLQTNSQVTLKIFDLSGKEMIILVNEIQQHGEQKIIFNTSDLPAGIYFCVLKTNPPAGGQTKKIIKL